MKPNKQDSPDVAQFKALFESMNEGVVVHDNLGNIIRYNSASKSILGMTDEELSKGDLNQEWHLINEDGSRLMDHEFPASVTLKTGIPKLNQVLGIVRKDGTLRWLNVSATPIFRDEISKPFQVLVTFIDITNEKNAQEENLRIQKILISREHFLKTTLDALPQLVSFIDKNLKYAYVNQTYAKWFGHSQSDFIGKTVLEVLGKDAYEVILPYINKVRSGIPARFESRVPYQSAGEKIVEVLYLPSGRPEDENGFYAIITDVTDLVNAREEIRKSEEDLDTILNSIPSMIGYWDKNLINVHANNAYSEYFGKTPEQIKGIHIKDLLGPELFEKNKKYIDAALRGEPQTFERQLTLTKGGIRHTIANYLPDISNNQVNGFFVNVTDVSPLKLSEARFKSLLESAADPMIILDEEGKIQLVNHQTEKVFGYNQNELIGKSARIILPERYHDLFETNLSKYILNPQILLLGDKTELFAKRKFKTEFPFEVSISPLQIDEGILISCTIRDITERRKDEKEKQDLLQKEHRARKVAEEAIQMRDDLVAVVSHDLRNPLSIIIGNIDLLLRKNNLESSIIQKLNRMKKSSNQMLKMIKDLLDIHKIEQGNFDIDSDKSVYECESILKEVIDTQSLLASEKNIKLILTYNDNLPEIFVNSQQILRVFQNLIGNALKFTPPDGKITVRAEASDGHVIFSVEDTGPGIEKELLPKVFDRFTQGKRTALQGAGLGLAICKGIIEAHDGKIWVTSQPGKGTKFFFSLPAYSFTSLSAH